MTRASANRMRIFDGEDALPRVPLPTLEESCRRLLAWSAPLLTADELAATRGAVARFMHAGGPANGLQAALERYDRGGEANSWLDAFWADRYLGRRDRIALNANFFFLLEDAGPGQVDRAAALVAATLRYKHRLDEQRVPAVVQRGRPQSMEQHKFLFSTTRIPGRSRDTVRAPYSHGWPGPSRARHIVVLRRGIMYRMEVAGEDGRPRATDELVGALRAIMAASAVDARADESVGHLTTMARAEWAERREALRDLHPRNRRQLDTIETALFCLCLEESAPTDVEAACAALLHGDGGNRWFDKALSLIVFADGTAGLNAEHSRLDGSTVLELVDGLVGAPAQAPRRSSSAVPAIEPLTFVLDDQLRADVRAAGVAFAAHAAGTVNAALKFDDVGAHEARRLGISPDAFAQLAFQLAQRRARGFLGSTYESISTRHYRHGRTEAMRVVTPEIVRFTSAMNDPHARSAVRSAALRSAANAHVARVRACQDGRAPEQHLWALELLQRRRGAALGATEPLALHASPGWRRMRDDCLSTSATASLHVQYAGFGPTRGRCIGVAYAMHPDRLSIHLSAPSTIGDGMARFGEQLGRAVTELRHLLAAVATR